MGNLLGPQLLLQCDRGGWCGSVGWVSSEGIGQAVPSTGVVSRKDPLLEDSRIILPRLSLGFSHCLSKSHTPGQLCSSLEHHSSSCASSSSRARSIVATAGLYLQLPCVLLGGADLPALCERWELVAEFPQTLKTPLCSAVKLFCCRSNPLLASSVGGDGQSAFAP